MSSDRNIFVVPTINGLRAIPSQENWRFCFVEELGAVFRWVLNSTQTDDGFKVIVPSVLPFLGAWIRVATPSYPAGAALLGNADVTIDIGQGFYRQMPAATLTADHVITVDPGSNNLGGPATDNGDEIEIARFDTTAHSLTIVNGGPAGGTLKVLPPSQASMVVVKSDGVNFSLRHAMLLL